MAGTGMGAGSHGDRDAQRDDCQRDACSAHRYPGVRETKTRSTSIGLLDVSPGRDAKSDRRDPSHARQARKAQNPQYQ